MKPMTLNMSKLKKIASDQHSSTFLHPDGHQMKIAHAAISPLQRKQLEKMPIQKMAEGGEALPPELADLPQSEAPAVAEPSLGERIGADVRGGLGDAVGALKTVGGAVLSPLSGFAKGLVGEPEAAAAIPASAEMGTPPAQATIPAQDSSPTPSPQEVAAAANAKSLDSIENSIKSAQGAEQGAARKSADAWNDYADKSSKMVPVEDIIKAGHQADKKFVDDLSNQNINPDRYWESKSAGQKIAASIGLLLGGLGAGLAGGPNVVAEHLNKLIDSDIDAQKANQSKTMNLWKMNRDATHDDVQANLLTRNQLLGTVEAKIKGIQAQAGGAESAMRLAPLLLSIEQQKAANTTRAMALRSVQGGNSQPEQVIPYLVPAEHQKEAIKEAGQAKYASERHDFLMEQFDKAAKQNTVARTLGGILTPDSIISMNALELPLIHDQEGRVNEFEQKTVQALHPTQGDLPAKVAAKRIGYEKFITGKENTPTLDTYAPGLSSKFKSTNTAQPASVERVDKSGRVALFNPSTKQFLGYKQ